MSYWKTEKREEGERSLFVYRRGGGKMGRSKKSFRDPLSVPVQASEEITVPN